MHLGKVVYNSVPYPNLTGAAYIICIYFIKRRVGSDIVSVKNYRHSNNRNQTGSLPFSVKRNRFPPAQGGKWDMPCI